MTWNGSGTFNPPPAPDYPAVANDLITAAHYNAVIVALCAAFDNVVPRDGQAPVTGNIDMNSLYRLINMPAAIANGQPVRYNEFTTLQATVAALGAVVEPIVLKKAGII